MGNGEPLDNGNERRAKSSLGEHSSASRLRSKHLALKNEGTGITPG